VAIPKVRRKFPACVAVAYISAFRVRSFRPDVEGPPMSGDGKTGFIYWHVIGLSCPMTLVFILSPIAQKRKRHGTPKR